MRTLPPALQGLGAIVGLVAALFWWKAARTEVRDPFPQDGISHNVESGDFVGPIMDAFKVSAEWNKRAAYLTAISVALGALGTLAGAIGG